MIDVLSPEFFRYLNKTRIENNIYVRALWPEKQAVDVSKHPYLGVGKEFLREIRIAPPGIDCTMGYWIYGNKVAFISSRKEAFGFIIESAELVQLLLTQFDMIWGLSRPLKGDSDAAAEFLKEMRTRKR
jgi:HTH-type transcriptional regulator, sugar sensing transcriptional regulator